MKNYKRLLGLVLAFAMFVSLIACSGKESTSSEAPSDPSASTDSAGSESDDYPTVTWKIAHSAQDGGSSDLACEAVKAYVEEKTGGKITIDLYPAGQLGPLRPCHLHRRVGHSVVGHPLLLPHGVGQLPGLYAAV